MQWLQDFMASAKTTVAQFNNTNFKNATMAVCALIAAADGVVEPEEKSKVAALIGRCEALSCFDAVPLRDLFLSYCEKAGDEFARLDLLTLVRKIATHRDQAETAMKIAIIIANADGEFEDSEKVVVKELCGILGLPTENYIPQESKA